MMSEEMACRKRRLSSFQIIILGFAGVILLGAPLGERSHHLLHTDHFGWQMPLAPNLDEDVRVIRKVR